MIAPVTRQKAWRMAHPKRYLAHMHVEKAKRRGDLVPQPCEVCGKHTVDAHHDDYDRPLDVRWLCRRHHVQHHARLNTSKGTFKGACKGA